MTSETTTGTVTSADGTTIAYERTGSGPVLILIASALSARGDLKHLSTLLAKTHTIVNYDRRGRGESSDTPPYAKEREVEDIAALLAEYPRAALFGTSSGAVLALDAASALDVAAVIAYEAPIIVDNSCAPVPHSLADDIDKLVDDGHPGAATRLFMQQALGAGWLMLGILMAFWPMWRGMVKMARTAGYDCRLCQGLQDGTALPDRWRIRAPVLIAVGENTEEFIQTSSAKVAEVLGATREVVKGAHHGSPVMNPAALVPLIDQFLASQTDSKTAGEAHESEETAKTASDSKTAGEGVPESETVANTATDSKTAVETAPESETTAATATDPEAETVPAHDDLK